MTLPIDSQDLEKNNLPVQCWTLPNECTILVSVLNHTRVFSLKNDSKLSNVFVRGILVVIVNITKLPAVTIFVVLWCSNIYNNMNHQLVMYSLVTTRFKSHLGT